MVSIKYKMKIIIFILNIKFYGVVLCVYLCTTVQLMELCTKNL